MRTMRLRAGIRGQCPDTEALLGQQHSRKHTLKGHHNYPPFQRRKLTQRG